MNNKSLSNYHKTHGLDFIVNEMIKLIDEESMTQEELEWGLEINNLYADYIYNEHVKILEEKIESLENLKCLQDVLLENLSTVDNEDDKAAILFSLKLIHHASEDGDLDADINSVNEKINTLKLELFNLKNEY